MLESYGEVSGTWFRINGHIAYHFAPVNVDGTYLFATGVARHLMERKAPGSIVFIGSMSGAIVNVPQPQAPYNASKAAVRHLGRSLAVEWAHANIRVNVIEPGYMVSVEVRFNTAVILTFNPAYCTHREDS